MLGVLPIKGGSVEILVGLPLVTHSVGIVGKGVRKCASEEDMAGWRRLLFPIGALITIIGINRGLRLGQPRMKKITSKPQRALATRGFTPQRYSQMNLDCC